MNFLTDELNLLFWGTDKFEWCDRPAAVAIRATYCTHTINAVSVKEKGALVEQLVIAALSIKNLAILSTKRCSNSKKDFSWKKKSMHQQTDTWRSYSLNGT